MNLFGPPSIEKLVAKKKTERILKLLYHRDFSVQKKAIWGVEELLEPKALPILWQIAGTGNFSNSALAERAITAILYLTYKLNDENLSRNTCSRFLEFGFSYRKGARPIFKLATPFLPRLKVYLNEELIKIFRSDNIEKQRESRYLIELIKDPSLTPVLINALESPSSWTRRFATECLGKTGDESAIDSLIAYSKTLYQDITGGYYKPGEFDKNNSRYELEECVQSLGLLKASQAIDVLVPLLESDDKGIQTAAIIALGEIGGEKVTEHVLKMEVAYDSFKWIDVVRKIGDPRFVERLKVFLTDPNDGLKQRAADTMRTIVGHVPVSLEFIAEQFNKKCRDIYYSITGANSQFWHFGTPDGKIPVPSTNELIEKARQAIQDIYRLSYDDQQEMMKTAYQLRLSMPETYSFLKEH
jgi:hypothetical protein